MASVAKSDYWCRTQTFDNVANMVAENRYCSALHERLRLHSGNDHALLEFQVSSKHSQAEEVCRCTQPGFKLPIRAMRHELELTSEVYTSSSEAPSSEDVILDFVHVWSYLCTSSYDTPSVRP